MVMRAASVILVACMLAGGCGAESADDESEPSPAVSTKSPSFALQCASGRSSSSTIDVIPPETAAEARRQGWPRSPEEAARNTVSAPAFSAQLKNLNLSDGTPVTLGGGTEAVRFVLTDAAGTVQATLTVQELLTDVWATTEVANCA